MTRRFFFLISGEGANKETKPTQGHDSDMKDWTVVMETFLLGIAKKASEEKGYRFRNLYRFLNEEFLRECWGRLNKRAASGVDGQTAKAYEEHLEENVKELAKRLKAKSYWPKNIRRVWIPKGNGNIRPLGIPVVEDKLVQMGAARMLEAIYEQDFYRSSYGYRPNQGAHKAIDKMTVKLQFGNYRHVVEADIENFFGTIDQKRLIQILEKRIDDGAFVGLIEKWLKAGVMEEGKVTHSATGTPQGGVISPMLSNIYLHEALDKWFYTKFRPVCRGEAMLLRYCDDFVCAFEHEDEAKRFQAELKSRMLEYGLKLSEEKTRVIAFNRGQSKTHFDFLGFEFRWGLNRQGTEHLFRRTARKNFRRGLKRLTTWCMGNRNLRRGEFMTKLNAKLRGTWNYYGLVDNSSRLWAFFYLALQIVFKWLNRANQRRSLNWSGFKQMLEVFQIARPVNLKPRFSYAK